MGGNRLISVMRAGVLLSSWLVLASCGSKITVDGDAGTDGGCAVDCDDGLDCTRDECVGGACVNTAEDSACGGDDIACTTARCDPSLGCVVDLDDSRCDDGISCTADACTEVGCSHTPTVGACDDGIDCTDDLCGEEGCFAVPNHALCAAGQICRADAGGCTDPVECVAGDDARCDDGQPCTTDRCNADLGRCENVPDDTVCNDDLFCNGNEICVAFRGCVLDRATACDDGVFCTLDRCNEDTDSCEHSPANVLCSDDLFCNGAETCDPTAGCTVAADPCDDGDVCTTNTCDEATNMCASGAFDEDGDGDPPLSCGGTDCADDNPDLAGTLPEICDGDDDDCDTLVDEGVLSSCGDCDPGCVRQTRTGADFTGPGANGTEYDPAEGGLIISTDVTNADYLWIVNTNESTLARWDAGTQLEVARYRVGSPAGECPGICCHSGPCNMASRTVVDGNGDAYVASRGFNMVGSVTKIAGHISDCVDRNDNGMIDTSTTTTPMAYGEDECVLWTADVGPSNTLLRALAIDGGDAMHPEGYVWVGGYNTAEFWKLDPDDGSVLLNVPTPGVNPYGAVVIGDGRLFVGVLGNAQTAHFDTTAADPAATYTTLPWPAFRGCSQAYGITADADGRVWFAGWGCQDALAYDTTSGEWSRFIGFGATAGRGITVDSTGRVWMAITANPSRLAWWNTSDFVAGGTVTVPPAQIVNNMVGDSEPSAIGADQSGRIWMAHTDTTSSLYRFDPADLSVRETFPGTTNRVYSYTDFTGGVFRSIIGTGSFEEEWDATCAAPVYDDLEYDVSTPGGTSVEFVLRTADTAAGLDAATPVIAATVPVDVSPFDINDALVGAGETPGQFLRLTVRLNGDSGETPVLRDYTITWRCP